MDVNKIVFLGDAHVKGVGAEWPFLFRELVGVPTQFRENMWYNYIRTTNDPPLTVNTSFSSYMSKQKVRPKSVDTYRSKSSYVSLIGTNYNKEIVNLGFEAYNLYQISAKLLVSRPTFENNLVILAVPNLKNDIIYHNPINTQKFENVTIPYVASIINLIKEFVEARGGKFVYFHQDTYPSELYDIKHNPFISSLIDSRLFDIGLFESCYHKINSMKIDGIHYDSKAHKIISRKFIEEFENSLIFSILMS